jgi:hypothetical protein
MTDRYDLLERFQLLHAVLTCYRRLFFLSLGIKIKIQKCGNVCRARNAPTHERALPRSLTIDLADAESDVLTLYSHTRLASQVSTREGQPASAFPQKQAPLYTDMAA